MTEPLHNWAGNYTYQAARIHRPTTLEELQELVRRSTQLRVLGSRHSFNTIADTPADLIRLDAFDRIVGFDRERHTVTVEAGITYGQLCPQLHAAGYALPNMASLPHISVAGSCATATHGSGDQNGNLATAVVALELMAADGTLVQHDRAADPAHFPGLVVALGSLGVVTKLTLQLVPTFQMRQDAYEDLPLASLETHFDALTASGYSVSFFTDWRNDRVNQVWLKRVVTEGTDTATAPELFGARPAPTHRHPITALSPINCTPQLGSIGPWHERLPHFRMEFTPSSGAELQSEYFVPRQHALAALRAINGMGERLAPCLMISEIRTIAADDLWLSPCYQTPCVAFHFTWHPDWAAVRTLLPHVEATLAQYGARPHWGKLFTMEPAHVQAQYPRLADFQALLAQHDPRGTFRNSFVERYLVGAP
jgi:alditol oxidase